MAVCHPKACSSRTLAYLMVGLAVRSRRERSRIATQKPQAVDVRRGPSTIETLGGFRTQLDADAERARELALAAPPKAVANTQREAGAPQQEVRMAHGFD